VEIVKQDLINGQHRNPTGNPHYFTDAFFHHPDELRAEIEYVSLGITESVLKHIFIFAEALKGLINKDRTQVNQLLIKRSNYEVRNLTELLNLFVEKAKKGGIIDIDINFNVILD
ncbi:MAG: hypothetical protein ACFFG0_50830, partial [Candidatus Thorarchaeota archaeon]